MLKVCRVHVYFHVLVISVPCAYSTRKNMDGAVAAPFDVLHLVFDGMRSGGQKVIDSSRVPLHPCILYDISSYVYFHAKQVFEGLFLYFLFFRLSDSGNINVAELLISAE